MSYEFDHSKVMEMFEKKRKKFMVMTGEMGASLAATNSRFDLGASHGSKQYTWADPDSVGPFHDLNDIKKIKGSAKNSQRIYILAPMEYDVYLERRYGVMAKTEDQLIPWMEKFEEICFG
jgi:hypothetical protein